MVPQPLPPPRQGCHSYSRIVPDDEQRCGKEDEVVTSLMDRGRPACKPWVLAITMLLMFLTMPLLVTSVNATCMPGMRTPGITTPSGDIILEEGNPLKINCTIDRTHPSARGKNSSDLVFFQDNREVPARYVTTINETTIQLTVENLAMSNYIYYCKLRTEYALEPVCLNSVIVGRKPEEVQDFTCVSHNWEKLECRWSVKENPAKTIYKIFFNLQGRAGRRFNATCPMDTDVKNNTCMWDASTNPLYRTPHEYYYFTLTGMNDLANVTFPAIRFHHYAHVIPSSPVELQTHNVTTKSVDLTWSIPLPLPHFPPGLLHKVEYHSQWDPENHWEIANTTALRRNEKNLTFHLGNLKYAHTKYKIRVMMKSSLAVGDSKWSIPANATISTASTIPGTSPKTDIGSFEIVGGMDGRRDVYIYWQRIPKYLQNGDNFEYRIIQEEENGEKENLTPNETTMTYARIKNLTNNSYKFMIYASNNVGQSEFPSTITIPNNNAKLPEPLSFTKIAFGNGVYELSWKKPVDYRVIKNYTVFWCDNERDRPYQCTGFLNWTHVSNDVNIINITVPDDKIYQFAISANTYNSSSGIIWATCTVIHNKGIGKMKNFWINKVGSSFVESGWKLECSDRIGQVKGYRIYYCPIVSPENITCRDPVKNTTIIDDIHGNIIHGNITGLMPYTTYMVSVSVISRGGEGQQSDRKLATTMEAAPEPPMNVVVTDVTNTSMVVSWSPPRLMNGVLHYYFVHYKNYSRESKIKVEGKTSVKLQDLQSFVDHTVFVTACTISCSEPSENVTVETAIGNPGILEIQDIQRNVSQFNVSWYEPSIPGGLLDHYELEVEEVGADKNLTTSFNTSSTYQVVPLRECKPDEIARKYSFKVRAVNIDENKTLFYGQWSAAKTRSTCYDSAITQKTVILWTIGVVVVAMLGLATWFYGKKCVACCREMQNVEVKLPAGLDSPKDLDNVSLSLNHCNGSTRPGEINGKKLPNGMAESEDQRGLLSKNNERHGRNPSGDSSGCSSGHDSVSSSLTSHTHISSDSGAEVDQLNVLTLSSGGYDHDHLHKSRDGDNRWDLFSKQSHYNGSTCSARSTPNLSTPPLASDVDSNGEVRSDGSRYSYLGSCPSTGILPTRSGHQPLASSSSSTLYCKVGSLEATPTHSTSYCKVGFTTPPTALVAAEDVPLRSQVPSSLPNKGGYIPLANVNSITRGAAPVVSAPSSGYVAHPAVWSSPSIEAVPSPSVTPPSPAALQVTPVTQNRTLSFNDESCKEHQNVPHLECIPVRGGDPYTRVGCGSSWQPPNSRGTGSALSLTEMVIEPPAPTSTTTSSYVKVGETPKTVIPPPSTPDNPPISNNISAPNSSGYVMWSCDATRRPTPTTTSGYVPHRQLDPKCNTESAPTPPAASDSYPRVCSVPNSPELDTNSAGGNTGTNVAGTAASL